jgi:FkbM family methyltransferase
MTFISYAQNFEDVMLWRALKDVENGFYIDVGANDPSIDSVTKAFYERGWHGINIEPLASHHSDLQRERPRDINLQCAAGARRGKVKLWNCDVRGWATASKSIIDRHIADGYSGTFCQVPVIPLSAICKTHVKSDIHFLKIDVEGFEKSVIAGMDFSRFRPWILLIEATRPNTQEEMYEEWEEMIVSHNYLFAYADGLNRFYVPEEKSELLTMLRYPPNVFDGFIRAEQLNFRLRAEQAEERAQKQASLEEALEKTRTELERARAGFAQVQNELFEAQRASDHHWQLAEERQKLVRLAEARVEDWRKLAEERTQKQASLEVALENTHTELERVRAGFAQIQSELIETQRARDHYWQLAEERQGLVGLAEAKVEDLRKLADVQAQQIKEAHARIEALHASTSWRVTRPLRGVKRVLCGDARPVRQMVARVVLKVKIAVKPLIAEGIRFVYRYPALRAPAIRMIKKWPGLYYRLRHVAANTGAVPGLVPRREIVLEHMANCTDEQESALIPAQGNGNEHETLSPHARHIFMSLKNAMVRRQGGSN